MCHDGNMELDDLCRRIEARTGEDVRPHLERLQSEPDPVEPERFLDHLHTKEVIGTALFCELHSIGKIEVTTIDALLRHRPASVVPVQEGGSDSECETLVEPSRQLDDPQQSEEAGDTLYAFEGDTRVVFGDMAGSPELRGGEEPSPRPRTTSHTPQHAASGPPFHLNPRFPVPRQRNVDPG